MICFFNDTATTEIYTLSLHDALPILALTKKAGDGTVLARKFLKQGFKNIVAIGGDGTLNEVANGFFEDPRSEEHTSELQSRQYLVCRLLLEKKKICRPMHSLHIRYCL